MRLLDSPANERGATEPVIVVGLDGSPTSWDAFTWAAVEATRTHGRLIAVYVAPAVEPGAEFGAPLNYGAAVYPQRRDGRATEGRGRTAGS
jgi:hypothetical protein